MLLDFGPVLGGNVEFFGDRLGCKLFIEDIFKDVDRHTRAGTLEDLADGFETRFRHADGSVDGILCWDCFDFLDKASVQALARQIVRLLRPGGVVMGLFCTSSVERTSYTKYEIVDEKNLRYRQHAGAGGARRALQNRDIIRMFEGLTRLRLVPAQEQHARDAAPATIGAASASPAILPACPVIALLSDFGTRDHYAGTMKGVMLGIAPDAVLVDLTHDIPPHDILQGALQLAAAVPYFPAGTIFLLSSIPASGRRDAASWSKPGTTGSSPLTTGC